MKKVIFSISFIFALFASVGMTAQSATCAKKCTKTCTKKVAQKAQASTDTQVASAVMIKDVDGTERICTPEEMKNCSKECKIRCAKAMAEQAAANGGTQVASASMEKEVTTKSKTCAKSCAKTCTKSKAMAEAKANKPVKQMVAVKANAKPMPAKATTKTAVAKSFQK